MKKQRARPEDRKKLIQEFKASREKLMSKTASLIALLKEIETRLKGDK